MAPAAALDAEEPLLLEGSDDGAELEREAGDEEVLAIASDGTTGALLKSVEGLLLHPSLALARDAFFEQHCQGYEAATHSRRQELFEAFKATLQDALTQAQQQGAGVATGKSLQELAQDVQAEGGDVDQEVLEMVAVTTDFEAFAAAMAEWATADDGELEGGALSVQGSKAVLHAEEQEDGEERPDLVWT